MKKDELITQQQFAELTGVSRAKINIIAKDPKFNFPPPVKKLQHGTLAYDKKQTEIWRQTNDPKKIVIPNNYRPKALIDDAKTNKSPLDNKLAFLFLTFQIGKIIDRLPRTGKKVKTVVVHLQERNDYTPPHSGLNKQSNTDVGYDISLPNAFY